MSVELVAIAMLIAWSVVSFIGSIVYAKKERDQLLDSFDIDSIEARFTAIVNDRLQAAIDAIGESFGEILSQPTVKKAFSIIGSQGGDARASNAAVDAMAQDFLNGPQFAGIQIAAEALGFDIEKYIEKYGPMRTIQAAQQFAGAVGIDLMHLDMGNIKSLAGPATRSSGNHPFLGR